MSLLGAYLSTRRREDLLGLLAKAGRGEGGETWETRCLAALLLQGVARGLAGQRSWAALLSALGMTPAEGEELPGRLERGERVFRPLQGAATSTAAWRDLLRWSRRECDLILARHLFTPEEVVARVRSALRISRGEREIVQGMVATEAADALSRLPAFEAEIATGLLGSGESPAIYWSSPETSQGFHALVEAPEGTVVVTVKPPGSGYELEIKRTGVRRPCPLGVVFERNGEPVPPSHRLDGGSGLRQLHFDAVASARFARLFRIVHEEEAPISRVLAVHAVRTVPSREGEAHLVDHLSREEVFGPGFAAMREALRESVEAFDREMGTPLTEQSGDLWLTARFLSHAPPGQALLSGTSSFRLDKVASGLATGERRERVEALLDEALGVYEPPAVPFRDAASFVAAALEVPANRARADRAHADALATLGRMRGTLLALGGWSNGESFVPRNVGLRSQWQGGGWQVRLAFMDHDDLHVEPESFRPLTALAGMELDEEFARHARRCLARIYGVPLQRGRGVLRRAMAAAYRQTLRCLEEGSLDGVLSSEGSRWLLDWSRLLVRFRSGPPLPEGWQRRFRRSLRSRGWNNHRSWYAVEALERHEPFLRGYAFLD